MVFGREQIGGQFDSSALFKMLAGRIADDPFQKSVRNSLFDRSYWSDWALLRSNVSADSDVDAMFDTNGEFWLVGLYCAQLICDLVIGLIHLTQILVREFKKQNSGVSHPL